MALTRIKENQITDLAVTNAKIANATIAGGKLATNLSYGSDLTVTGNLTVSGTTTSVATTNTRIDDAILVLANGTSGSPSEDSGFIIDRGDSNNMALLWDETADVFILVDVGAEDGDTVGNVTVSGTRQTLQMGPLVATTGTFSGVVAATGFTIGSAVIAESELEMIDGITAGTAAASKAVVLDSSTNITGIGTISCGVITATGFTIGSAVINEAELETIDGVTVGTAIASKVVTTNSDIDTTGQRNLTISGELDAATLDISGNADIDGTLEADAITVDGTTLAEFIADTAGAMVSSNTETGITVTYQDGDNTIDFAVDAAQTAITSIYNSSLAIGYGSSHANIDFGTDNRIVFDIDGTSQVLVLDGVFRPTTDSDVDLGSSAKYWKDAYIDTITTTGLITSGSNLVIADDGNIGSASDTNAIAIASDGVVTMDQIPVFSAGINVSGGTIAGTLATVAQGNVTSLGTLTTLTVDNIIINGTNIGHTSVTNAIAIASNGVVTFSQNPVFPDGGVDIADLDIDGGTDINAALVDADLLIVDDGAGGTNRKTTMARVKTYINAIDEATAIAIALG